MEGTARGNAKTEVADFLGFDCCENYTVFNECIVTLKAFIQLPQQEVKILVFSLFLPLIVFVILFEKRTQIIQNIML